METALNRFAQAARQPDETARNWKAKTGKKVVGTFAMHFPAEIIHAAGALPVLLQVSDEPITVGHSGMYPFFCGYTRSLVDQNAKGRLDYLDAIFFGDHCVQLLSAADIIRVQKPDRHVGFYQLIPALRDNWSFENAQRTLNRCIEGLEQELDVVVTEEGLRDSIRLFNTNRQMIRELYDLRRQGKIHIGSSQMQNIVKSSMVMDKAEHNALLSSLMDGARQGNFGDVTPGVPVYLSGHMCHAPKPEILEMIEACGAHVVDDDLFTGFRYVSLDADESGDPVKSLTKWYLGRNTIVPCPTRLDPKIDWDGWLLNDARNAGASGLIVLLVKYCEPHYFYYPRIKKTFEDAGFPHLVLETEHESSAGGAMQVRVESFLEMIKQKRRPQVSTV